MTTTPNPAPANRLRTIRGAVLIADFRTATTGTFLANLVLREDGRTNNSRAVLFAKTARAFEHAMREHLENAKDGAIRMKAEFTGFWKKRTWTDKEGKERTSWEFNIRNFALAGILRMTDEEAFPARTAETAETDEPAPAEVAQPDAPVATSASVVQHEDDKPFYSTNGAYVSEDDEHSMFA